MENKETKIRCYADNVILAEEIKDDFPPQIYLKPLIKKRKAEIRQMICQGGQLFNQN